MLDSDISEPFYEELSPTEQGFCEMGFPLLKRKGAENNEYYVFVDETEFKTVIADTVVLAMEKCEVTTPYKVVPAHRRIHDVVKNENLEFVKGREEVLVQDSLAPAGEVAAAPDENPPPTPDAAPATPAA